jgi:hypothetical protein
MFHTKNTAAARLLTGNFEILVRSRSRVSKLEVRKPPAAAPVLPILDRCWM